jgi:hypothetical protein
MDIDVKIKEDNIVEEKGTSVPVSSNRDCRDRDRNKDHDYDRDKDRDRDCDRDRDRRDSHRESRREPGQSRRWRWQ